MFSKDKQSDNRILLDKINSFIKKFYLNRLIQGALIGALLLIVSFILINTVEFISWFSGKIRFYLFILLIAITSFILIFYFIIPLANLIRFRKKMSKEEAAVIIGKFFPEIKDKLLNTLQLVDKADSPTNELLLAAIEQKTIELKPIRFSDAVDFKDNYKYLKIFVPAFVASILLVIFLPDFSRQPINRIVNYDKEYEKPFPFQVVIPSTYIEAIQGEDLEFKVKVTGEGIPENFYVMTEVGNRMMTRISNNEYRYVFNNVYHSETFNVVAGDYKSPDIKIDVRPTPLLLSYTTELFYPKYIRRDNETLVGKTRAIVPQGTTLNYVFHTSDVAMMNIIQDTITHEIIPVDDVCTFKIKALQSQKLFVKVTNRWNDEATPIPFVIEVVPDAYPEIQVQTFNEDFSKKNYYSGLIADDYGFSRLLFHFEVENKPNQSFVNPISIEKNQIRTSFYYSLDTDTLEIYPGDEMKLYFEIWDNDAINGSKSRRSDLFYLTLPTRETLDSIADASEESVISKLEEKTSDLNKLRQDIEEMLKDLMSKKELDWSDKEKMKDLLEKQKEVQEEWENIKQEQKELQDFIENNDLTSEELLKKQEQINKLFEEVIPDEMKQLMEEMEKLLSEMPREKMQQMMQDLKKSSKELQEMMDRNLSLLEQLKVEKDINELIDKFENLADKLMKTNETNNDSLSASEAKEQFNDLLKQMDSIMEKDKKLQEPFNISKDEKAIEEINDDLDKSGEMENNGDDSGSSQKKQDAGKKMQEMAEQLSNDMMMAGMEQLGEDAHLVRILLENVVRSSHEEEALMGNISKMKTDDPSLSDKISRQKELVDNFVMVKDSLREMAMRQPDIRNFVFEELQIIDDQLTLAMRDMNDLKLGSAVSKQQRAMMSMNNLALMLSESLNDMNMSMMEASGSCSKQKNSKKPNKGGKSMKNMKDLQEQLGKQLEQLREQMNQQKQRGGQSRPMSEEFARMAAQQEMLREEMQKILNEMKENGIVGDDGINDIIKDMEKLEEDIVNKRITQQTINRNKDILSRMLKADNAQQEREKEEKRKSEEFKGSYEKRNIDELEYQENLKRQQEFLRSNSIDYQPFYKNKINEYFFKKNNK